MIRILTLLLLFCFSITGIAQKDKELLAIYNDSIKQFAPVILSSKNDSTKSKAQEITLRCFKTALSQPNSYGYKFDSLQSISIKNAPDNRFRIITWIYPLNDGTFKYFGFIQTIDKKKVEKVFELKDNSENIQKPLLADLSPENWFGSLYYDILLNKRRGSRVYTLLSWDGNNSKSTKKIIDILYFNKGIPKFGKAIIAYEKKTYKRLIFEYNAQITVSIRYNESQKMILFDHIAPDHPINTGKFEHYGPDGSYDGLQFKKGKWRFIEDVDARNESEFDRKKPKEKKNLGLTAPNTKN